MSKKKILTGHVARIIDGVLVAAGPGDVAPDWVTNPALIDSGEEPASEPTTPTPATPPNAPEPPANADITDEFSDLGIKELRKLAEQEGVAKAGSKEEIANRLRAKRDADADAGKNDDDSADRAELVAKATAAGVEGAEDMTDAELAAVIEQGE